MGQQGKIIYASSAENPDILYASGFDAHDPFLFFETASAKGIVVSKLEAGRAEDMVKPGIEVFELDEFFEPEQKRRGPAETIARLARRFHADEWIVPYSFPCGVADVLRKRGFRIIPLDGPFMPERRAKSAEEIDAISNAMELAENAMDKVAAMIANATVDNDGTLLLDGETMTSEKLKFEIAAEILRGDGSAVDSIVACGKHAAQPHNQGSGPITAGKPIVVDIFPKGPSRYHGDITRTFLKGKAPSVVANAFVAVKEARDEATSAIQAETTAVEIHTIAKEILEKHGFKTEKRDGGNVGFFHGLGHGVGLDVHEPPRLSDKSSDVLRNGDVVTVEPGLYYPEWGGIRLEDLVVVRETGCDIITKFPTFLELE